MRADNQNEANIQEQEKEQFQYQIFQKTHSFPVPLIARNAKYTKILPLKELNFLEYYMLPEKDQFDFVYRPGDDSFFMLNVLRQEINQWPQKLNSNAQNMQSTPKDYIIAEVGSGSGILSAHVSSWLIQKKQQPFLHVSIDINMDASLLSQKYYDQYNLPVLQINTSLFKNTLFSQKSQLFQKIKPQIIIFNPPYIPVDKQQIQNEQKYLAQKIKQTALTKKCQRKRQQNIIAFSYMGGTDGLNITRKLLKSIFWSCWVYLIIMGQEGFLQINQQIQNYKQLWLQHHPKYEIKERLQLMQFMKYQNQDLFLIRVQVQVS